MKKEKLFKILVKIFQNYGLGKNHSIISSNALINAELVGAYGHGLTRLKMYCDRIKKK
jgi:L-2-hydroxycarboxylate dehydrogenase (NAD+)